MRVGLLLFDEFDLLDLGGPYEVLLTANRIAEADGDPAPFDVVVVGRGLATVRAYGGMQVTPDVTPEDGPFDLIIVPGAINMTPQLAKTWLLDDIRTMVASAETISSICTGSFLLVAAGVIGDATVTTHHEDIADLRALIGDDARVRDDRQWVTDGNVVTGAGLSSGIGTGLHLVERFAGLDLAVRTAAKIEYVWDPTGAR